MFNLVKYRWLFIAISLLVIIPGTISLALFHLRVGIDFAGGTNVTLRPQRDLSITELRDQLAPFKLQDLQIVPGDNTAVEAGKTIWVRLNTQVDSNVEAAIKDKITKKYPETNGKITPAVIPGVGGDKPFTLITISGFNKAPNLDEIKALLKDLPKTSDPTKSAAPPSTGPTAPVQGTATTTPKATATAQATPKATATAAATPAATPAANPANPANIAVSVVDIQQGRTTKTYTILTSSTNFLEQTNNSEINKIQSSFLAHGGPYFQVLSSSSVGPSVASQTTFNAALAILAASFFILLYIWFSFRKIPRAWRYGTCAIIALLHDVLVVLGIFSILGHFFGVQVDSLFITALLTVVGFSVHDTIVVFDRIRENMHRRVNETFEEVVNASLVQTMARSLNTSLTVLFTLLALTLFTTAGTSVHNFTLTLLIGIFSGTFSSIFNASMLLVIWENWDERRSRAGVSGRRAGGATTAKTRHEARDLARAK